MQAKTAAYAYLRVSSRGQVDGHGFDRQRRTIRDYARRAGVEIAGEFRDAHTGTEADRPAFADMLAAMLGDSVRTVVVEGLDRFARDMVVQAVLLAQLKAHGITLLSASTGEDVTAAVASDPMREAMVLIQAVFHQTEKKLLVRKLAKARQAMREHTGRCEGRKPYGARPGEAEIVDRILALRRKRPNGRAMSFLAIARQLNADAIPTRYGGPWQDRTVYGIVRHSRRPT